MPSQSSESLGRATGPVLLRVPAWDRFPWLRAGFSTRQGGRSFSYGANEWNLGWTEDGEHGAVAADRAAFVEVVGQGVPLRLVTVRQVHGAAVRDLEHESEPLTTDNGRALLEGDGVLSQTPGRLLAVVTADCVPVLIADTRTHAVGAFHAGWRGTLAGIVGQGVAEMQRLYGSRPSELVAAIGPGIGGCCFEIGGEVRAAFLQEFPESGDLFQIGPESGLHMDLREANRRQLLGAGLAPGAVSMVGECTACSRTANGARRYFSYRAEQGKTGRMLSGIAAVA